MELIQLEASVLDPVITEQPVGHDVPWGWSGELTVVATGTGLITYQWRKNGNPVDGANYPSLDLAEVQGTDSGDYDVVVSNSVGSVTSIGVTVTVLDPFVTQDPVSRTALIGESVDFSVSSVGTPPLTYQWRRNGLAIPTATNSNLTVVNAGESKAGYYDVVVSSTSGSCTSAVATLTVNLATLDAFQPRVDGVIGNISIQSDGKLLITGDFWEVDGTSQPYLARLNTNGTLDATFQPSLEWAYGVVIQPNQQILVYGDFYEVNGVSRPGLARLNPDGTLDTSFDPSIGGWIYSIALQPDGKILVAGEFYDVNGNSAPGIMRLNADGSVDSEFIRVIEGYATAIALQPDGKIVAAGEFDLPQVTILRLNLDGSVDTTFNSSLDGEVSSLVVQPDGKLLMGGYVYSPESDANLWRLHSDGTWDTTFTPGAADIYSFCLQADGKILAAGYVYGQETLRLWRYNSNGTRDPLFAPSVEGGDIYKLVVQPDGQILAAGDFSQLNGNARRYLGRFKNTTAPADSLSFDGSTVTWLRDGIGPEFWVTTFDASNDGTNWTSLGVGAYTTSGWQYAAAGSPLGYFIRARGYVADSRGGWVVENVLRPPAIVTQPFSQWVQVGQDATFTVVAAGTRPLTYQWFKDGTPIPDGTNSLFHITDAQLGDEADYSVIVMNGLGAVTSANAFLIVSPTLEMALDTTNLAWMTGGYAPWLGQTLIAHDLLDAARSGAIGHNQQSWIQTTVTGPGTLTFCWKVSSELGYDFLEVRTNTVLVERISGEVPWQQRTLSFAPGTHVLRWRYVKDDTLSKEKDRGWLDEVLFVPSQVGTPAVVSMGFNSNQFGLRITGNAGQAVVVEGSTNLVTWEVISTHVLENEPLHFVDPKAGAFPNRFYRARLQ